MVSGHNIDLCRYSLLHCDGSNAHQVRKENAPDDRRNVLFMPKPAVRLYYAYDPAGLVICDEFVAYTNNSSSCLYSIQDAYSH